VGPLSYCTGLPQVTDGVHDLQDVECQCECIEYTVKDSRQGVVCNLCRSGSAW